MSLDTMSSRACSSFWILFSFTASAWVCLDLEAEDPGAASAHNHTDIQNTHRDTYLLLSNGFGQQSLLAPVLLLHHLLLLLQKLQSSLLPPGFHNTNTTQHKHNPFKTRRLSKWRSLDVTPRHTDSWASCLSSSLTAGFSSSSALWSAAFSPSRSSPEPAGGSAGRGASSGGGRLRHSGAATGLFSEAIRSALSRWICCRLRPAGAGLRPRAAAAGVSVEQSRCQTASTGVLEPLPAR